MYISIKQKKMASSLTDLMTTIDEIKKCGIPEGQYLKMCNLIKATKERLDAAKKITLIVEEQESIMAALNRQVEFFKSCYGLDDITDETIMEHLLKRKRLVRVTFTKVKLMKEGDEVRFCARVKKKIFEVVTEPPPCTMWGDRGDAGIMLESDLKEWAEGEVLRSGDG